MAAAHRRQEAARARANAVVPPPRPPGYGTEELHSEEEEEEGEARERGERASGAGRSGGLTELRDLADVLSSDEEVEDAKAAEEKATAAAATESDAQEAAAKTASAQQATAQEGTQEALAAKLAEEKSVSGEVFPWLTERCGINANDAKLYADALADLGIDTPEDLHLIDGDEIAWPSVVKLAHRKKIAVRAPPPLNV